MSADCALAEFLRVGRPGRVPLRSCCVAALLAGRNGCPRRLRPAGTVDAPGADRVTAS